MPFSLGSTWVRRASLIGVTALTVVFAVGLAPATASNSDVTMTPKAKHSQAHRASINLQLWQESKHGREISRRESNNNCHVVSRNGVNRGKWQMTLQLWRGYGGRKFANSPERATCVEQDQVARRIWVAAWWTPWGG